MRVLICGGRHYDDKKLMYSFLDQIHEALNFTTVIEGDAPGADKMAGEWAEDLGLEHLVFPADWMAHGKAAGPIRNKKMLEEGQPELVIAFPGGPGTANMIKQAREEGIKVIELG